MSDLLFNLQRAVNRGSLGSVADDWDSESRINQKNSDPLRKMEFEKDRELEKDLEREENLPLKKQKTFSEMDAAMRILEGEEKKGKKPGTTQELIKRSKLSIREIKDVKKADEGGTGENATKEGSKQEKDVKKADASGAATSANASKEEHKQTEEAPVQDQRELAERNIEKYHTSLESVEREVFGDERLSKTKYEDVGWYKKGKRITKAVSREGYAKVIAKYEKLAAAQKKAPDIVNAQELEEELAIFMASKGEPFALSSDRSFVSNLALNYTLCEGAERIRRALEEAADKGYVPENIDLAKVEQRIANFESLKSYMDARRKMMQSPYYKYVSSEDVTYTDDQLKRFISGIETSSDEAFKKNNAELLEYLKNLKTLRDIKFDRKEGMKSLLSSSKEKARHEREILRTWAQKKEIISRFSEQALHFRGDKRFQEKDHDDNYSDGKFKKALEDFERMSVKELHFKHIQDLADHFAENEALFSRAREFSHMLFMHVRKGKEENQLDDERLLSVRAKLRTFQAAERVAYGISHWMIKNPEKALRNATFQEIWEAVSRDIRCVGDKGIPGQPTHLIEDGVDVPRLGENLEKYTRRIKKSYRREHDEREETIRTMYGLMHPVRPKEEMSEVNGWTLKEIEDEELQRRKKDFQKNCVINDYVANTEQYAATTWNYSYGSFTEVYRQRFGVDLDKLIQPKRSMSRYMVGKSSREFERIIQILQNGTPEEKEDFYRSVIREVSQVNLEDRTGRDVDRLLDNYAYNFNMDGALANFNDFKDYVSDKESQILAESLYDVGCGQSQQAGLLAANFKKRKWAHALEIKDLLNNISDDAIWFDTIVHNYFDLNDEPAPIAQNGRTYLDANTFMEYGNLLHVPSLVKGHFTSKENSQKVAEGIFSKEYMNTPEVERYQSMKRLGAWTQTSAEEAAALKDNYDKYFADYNKDIDRIRGYFKDTKIDKRQVERYVCILNALRVLEGENEEKLKNRVKVIADIWTDRPVEHQKKSYFRFVEEAASKLMDADLSEYNVGSYKELLNDSAESKDRFARLHALEVLSEHMVVELLNYGLHRREGSENDARIHDRAEHEIKARVHLIENTKGIFSDDFKSILNSPLLKKFSSLDEMLHQPPGYFEDEKKKPDADVMAIAYIESFIANLKGFDLHTPLSSLEDRARKEGDIRDNTMTPQNVAFILRGNDSLFKGEKKGRLHYAVAGRERFLEDFGTYFRPESKTVAEREKRITKRGTTQYRKNENAALLNAGSIEYRNAQLRKKREAGSALEEEIGDERLEDMLGFLEGNKEMDNDLLQRYAQIDTRFSALNEMTRKIMRAQGTVEMSTDRTVADSAAEMERLYSMAKGYRRLLEVNPEYAQQLKINADSDLGVNDYTLVKNKLNEIFALTNYYRARKLLISNSYYIRHKNKEMSGAFEADQSPEQRRITDLVALVSRCAEALGKNGRFDFETDTTDSVLLEYEKQAAQESFTSASPDLDRMDATKAGSAQDEVADFLRNGRYSAYNLERLVLRGEVKQEGKRYKTKAVNRYLEGTRASWMTNWKDSLDLFKNQVDDKKRDLLTRLLGNKKLPDNAFKYTDKKTGEVLEIPGKPTQIILDIVNTFGTEVPEEELVDMVNGLCSGLHSLPQSKKNDIRDIDGLAKTRWLRAAKKLFTWQYNYSKRFEKTYGSLIGDMPMGAFLHTLRDGQKDFILRAKICQNAGEMAVTKTCKKRGGEEVSLGVLLMEYGMLDQSEYEDCIGLNSGYYFVQIQKAKRFYNSPLYIFDRYKEKDEEYDKSYDFSNPGEVARENYYKEIYRVKGPVLGRGVRRKLWKEALKSSNNNLIGGRKNKEQNKAALDLYAVTERQEISTKRNAQAQTVNRIQKDAGKRKDQYYERILRDLNTVEEGKNINVKELPQKTKEMIKHLAVFHPEYREDLKNTQKKKERIERFLVNVIHFCGIGIGDKEKETKQKRAFTYFTDRANSLLYVSKQSAGRQMYTPKNLYKSEEPLSKGSDLYQLEIRHRMFDSLQELLAMQESTPKWFAPEEEKKFRNVLKDHLKYEVIYQTMRSPYYLKLRDIGGRHESEEGRDYVILQYLGQYLSQLESKDLDRDILSNPEFAAVLKKYNIRVDGPVERIYTFAVRGSITNRAKELADAAAQSEAKQTKAAGEAGEIRAEGKTDTKSAQMKEAAEGAGETRTTETKSNETKAAEQNIIVPGPAEARKIQKPFKELVGDERFKADLDEVKTLPYEERLEIFSEKNKEQIAAEMRAKGIPVPQSHAEYLDLRIPRRQYVWEGKIGGKGVPVHEVWLVDDATKFYIEWMGAYFYTQDKSLAVNQFEEDIEEQKIPENIHVDIEKDMKMWYDYQDTGNCYCVAGSAIAGQYVARKLGKNKVEKSFNQSEMRKFKPNIRKYDANLDRMPGSKTTGRAGFFSYVRAVNENVKLSQSAGSQRAGNIYVLGDFILDRVQKRLKNEKGNGQAPEPMLNRMVFSVPERNTDYRKKQINNLQAALMKKVEAIIKGGGVPALYSEILWGAHYITITGIDGDRLLYYDSASATATSQQSIKISRLLEKRGTLELNWISDSPGHKELTKQYKNLQYDEEKGYSLKETDAMAMELDVAHTKGIHVEKLDEEKDESLKGIKGLVSESVYILNPKAKVDSVPFDQYDAYLQPIKEAREAEDKANEIAYRKAAEEAKKLEEARRAEGAGKP